MPQNPYAVPTPAQRNGTAPPAMSIFGGNQRYAVRDIPESTDPEYTTGFSPELRAGGSASGEALPDQIRTKKRKTPIPGRNWNSPEWQAERDSEFLKRHSVEEYEVRGTQRQYKPSVPKIPVQTQDNLPTRPTATKSPAYATFQRPWHIPRNAKDALGENATTHFSMANHERQYEIFGMQPRGRLGVNTYRAQPKPWDENLYIAPRAGEVSGGIAGNRAFRL